ncbi:MAG: hypothetical protein HC817_15725 [Saprospiraceae bacterium]|nr:hypothetical protein [Saprospiraceae bacterium]
MERMTYFQGKIKETIEDYLVELRQPSNKDLEFVSVEDTNKSLSNHCNGLGRL